MSALLSPRGPRCGRRTGRKWVSTFPRSSAVSLRKQSKAKWPGERPATRFAAPLSDGLLRVFSRASGFRPLPLLLVLIDRLNVDLLAPDGIFDRLLALAPLTAYADLFLQ